MDKMSLSKIEKNLKKGVDKQGMIWYSKQAVRDDGGRSGAKKKVSAKLKKGLDKASEIW